MDAVKEQIKRMESSLSVDLPPRASRLVDEMPPVSTPLYERAPIQLDALGPDGYSRVPVATDLVVAAPEIPKMSAGKQHQKQKEEATTRKEDQKKRKEKIEEDRKARAEQKGKELRIRIDHIDQDYLLNYRPPSTFRVQRNLLHKYVATVRDQKVCVVKHLDEFTQGEAAKHWPPTSHVIYEEIQSYDALKLQIKNTWVALEYTETEHEFRKENIQEGIIIFRDGKLPTAWSNAEELWLKELEGAMENELVNPMTVPSTDQAMEVKFKSLLLSNMVYTCNGLSSNKNFHSEETIEGSDVLHAFAERDAKEFGEYTLEIMLQCYREFADL